MNKMKNKGGELMNLKEFNMQLNKFNLRLLGVIIAIIGYCVEVVVGVSVLLNVGWEAFWKIIFISFVIVMTGVIFMNESKK